MKIMDSIEREYVVKVINFFWGKGTTTAQQVNNDAAIVALEALSEAKVCSSSMNLVPRPKYGMVDIKHVIKELVKIGKRIAQGDTGIYDSCKGAVGVRYKSKIMMALMGI